MGRLVATEPGPFAEALRQLRRATALSQQELAARAGLSRRGISDLERGLRRSPHPGTVRRLAEAMRLTDSQRAALLAVGRRRAADDPGAPARDAGAPALPVPPSSFVGRERELAEVLRWLDATRLLTLTGPGGVGKTRLALEAARARAAQECDAGRRAVFVDLSAAADADGVGREIAAALRVVERPGRAVVASLLEHLERRPLLLLLDNCEHVISAVAGLVARLLPACADLRLLATSREPLGVTGEVVWPVPSLSLPDDGSPADVARSEAVQLFVERACATAPRFALADDNAGAVADVCRRLDGIPLAIELAASRCRALGVAQLARRLDDALGPGRPPARAARFELLTLGDRTAPPRHQTLRAALDWSYRLLSTDDRRLFDRLAVFAGGWTLEAAEAVCSGDGLEPDDVLDRLTRLVDKSLVQVEDAPGGQVRYRLLETIRQFAWERLAARGEAEAARDRHRAWCVAVAERGEREIWQADQLACIRRLECEHDNLRAALAWTLASRRDPEPGLRIAAALARFWDTHGNIHEGTSWLARLLAVPTVRRQTISWARATTALGYLTAMRQDARRAVRLLDECLPFWSALGHPRGLAVALFFRGVAVAWPSVDESALPFFEESLVLSRRRGPRWTTYISLFALGEAARIRGDLAGAERMLQESLAMADGAGDRFGAGLTLTGLSLLALKRGQTGSARALALDGLRRSIELGHTLGSTVALEGLGCIAVAEGRARQAARLFGAAETLRAPIGDFAHSSVRGDRARGIAVAKAQLGEAAFAAEWATGQALTLDEAVAYARVAEPAAAARARRVAVEHGALTPREIQILALLARRYSNGEIAEQLVLSVRTVERHVTNIYGKTGISRRREAAAYCLEHRLPPGD